MNFFDLTFLLVTLFFGLLAWFKGPIFEAIGLAGCLGGFFVAERLLRAGKLAELTGGWLQSTLMNYAAICLAGWLVGLLLGRLATALGLHPPKATGLKYLALFLGLFKSQVINVMIYALVVLYVPSFDDDLNRSMLRGWLGGMHHLLGGAKLALIG
ncbi:MAG: CvpA family protein [bacterium]|nr:CvpA family protein [bacterium]